MKTSAAGRAAISQREGNKLKAYKDSKGIWTIGVGHTAMAGPPAPKAGMVITAAQSDEILSRDLGDVEAVINQVVKVPLTQNQFDALASLTFNIGVGAFAKSTLVKRLNKGDYAGAREAILMWKKPKEIIGRRRTEYNQFGTRKPASAKQATPAPLATIVPKPSPAPVPVTDKELITRVQTGLTLLKYNPGGTDGVIGPLTAGAIRIFRADNSLPAGDFIDDELIATLASAKPREMVPARANAKAAEIAAVVPEAKSHSWNKIVALGSGAVTAAGGAIDQLAPATGYLEPVKNFLGEIPTVAWIAAIVVVAGVIWWNARTGQKAVDEAYRTGDRR